MWKKLKKIWWSILSIAFFVVIVVLAALFIHGGAWRGEKLYPWLVSISTITVLIFILFFLPLAIFRKTRAFAKFGMMISSLVFGICLWAYSLHITYNLLGMKAVYIGLIAFIVGVIPIAIIATIIKGIWLTLGKIVLLIILTFVTMRVRLSLKD